LIASQIAFGKTKNNEGNATGAVLPWVAVAVVLVILCGGLYYGIRMIE
jgi:hypothetical protein